MRLNDATRRHSARRHHRASFSSCSSCPGPFHAFGTNVPGPRFLQIPGKTGLSIQLDYHRSLDWVNSLLSSPLEFQIRRIIEKRKLVDDDFFKRDRVVARLGSAGGEWAREIEAALFSRDPRRETTSSQKNGWAANRATHGAPTRLFRLLLHRPAARNAL